MNGTEKYWKHALRSRFGDREDIGKDGFYDRYYSATTLPREALLELLELIEVEYDLSPGLLRPNDKLSKLLDPIPTRNPWRWLVYQARVEDRQSELNYRLAKRMHKYGTVGVWSKIETVDDLAHAWCGLRPK
jgi:hypothetical protein